VAEWLAAFPDIHFSVDQVVAERDLVAVHCTATGTHTGSWLGIPPTGRQITIRMAVTYRLAGGMIAEDWVLVDFLGVFQQLGLVQPTSELLRRSHQTEAGQS
jgi:predicted ester cyclase